MALATFLQLLRPQTLQEQRAIRGYRVQVFYAGGRWHFCIINQRGHVEICPPVATLAEGARRARAWIDEHHPEPG